MDSLVTDFNIIFIINSFIHVTLMYVRLTYLQIYVIYMYRCVKISTLSKAVYVQMLLCFICLSILPYST